MKILILAAGYGTRLYPLVKDTPKPLLEINGRPLIDYILDRFGQCQGISQVLVVTNNKFYKNFEQWAKKSVPFRSKIKIYNDGTQTPDDRLGSIGDIHFVLERLEGKEDIIVVGGDNLFDFNIDWFMSFSKDKSPATTIGVYDIFYKEAAKKFGVVEADKNGKIVSFKEKPPNPKSSLIAMCFYYFPKDSLGNIGQYLREVKKSDTAGDYIRWLCQKETVYSFKFSGKWYDIGSIEAYKEAQEKFK